MAQNKRIFAEKPLYGAIGIWEGKKMWMDKLANFFRNVCVGL